MGDLRTISNYIILSTTFNNSTIGYFYFAIESGEMFKELKKISSLNYFDSNFNFFSFSFTSYLNDKINKFDVLNISIMLTLDSKLALQISMSVLKAKVEPYHARLLLSDKLKCDFECKK